jgi:hypothetical protein
LERETGRYWCKFLCGIKVDIRDKCEKEEKKRREEINSGYTSPRIRSQGLPYG